MGMVSFDIMHTNDLDKHTINWYTHNTGNKAMKNPNDDYLVAMGVILLIGLAIWNIYG